MRYSINLKTRTYLDHRPLNRLGYCIITLFIVIAGWSVSRVASNMNEESRLAADITAARNKLGHKPDGISTTEFTRQKDHIRFYNSIIERKRFDWLRLLEAFESTAPEGIMLAALTPGRERGEWTVRGWGRSFSSLQRYVEQLETSKGFSHVLLLSHKSGIPGERVRGVEFSISCRVVTQ